MMMMMMMMTMMMMKMIPMTNEDDDDMMMAFMASMICVLWSVKPGVTLFIVPLRTICSSSHYDQVYISESHF